MTLSIQSRLLISWHESKATHPAYAFIDAFCKFAMQMQMQGSGPQTMQYIQIGWTLMEELLKSMCNVKICREPSITKDKWHYYNFSDKTSPRGTFLVNDR